MAAIWDNAPANNAKKTRKNKNMRKVIGIGETIFDIIFKNNVPTCAVPGGSTFNSMITLGRMGVPVHFITEVGNDKIGNMILDFMRDNNLTTENVDVFDDGRAQSPVSLAFLNDENDAQYAFYQQYPEKRLDFVWPIVEAGDLLIFGSYHAVNPQLRDKMTEFLSYARDQKAIIYYDVNFRKTYTHEAMRVMPAFLENLEYADIVRGSGEDFETLLKESSPERIYRNHISFYTPNFIFTDGGKGVDIFCNAGSRHIDIPPIKTVSTIGAGDNFNAGTLFGLLLENISRDELSDLSLARWGEIIKHGIAFASEVCQSYENYVSKEFAAAYPR